MHSLTAIRCVSLCQTHARDCTCSSSKLPTRGWQFDAVVAAGNPSDCRTPLTQPDGKQGVSLPLALSEASKRCCGAVLQAHSSKADELQRA